MVVPRMATLNHQRSEREDARPSQWSGLAARLIEDGSRVVELEARLLETRLMASLEALVDRAIAAMIVLYGALIGSSCLLTALIFLLHRWVPWWESFAVVGVLMLLIVFAMYAGTSRGMTIFSRTRLTQ